MKLPIKKKYFDLIKEGKKVEEFREAHITFECEETGESLRREINDCYFTKRHRLSKELKKIILEDDVIVFEIYQAR